VSLGFNGTVLPPKKTGVAGMTRESKDNGSKSETNKETFDWPTNNNISVLRVCILGRPLLSAKVRLIQIPAQ
jgi:hypothetical protein